MTDTFELGLYSFAEVTPDPITGKTITAAERLRRLIEEIELADKVGLDVYGVGEHHRPDFAVSAPARRDPRRRRAGGRRKDPLRARAFGNQRFLIQMSVGTMPDDKVLHAIELFGTKVAPIVRAEIGRRAAA